MKLTSDLPMAKRFGRANTVLWDLQKLAVDLEAEMAKMYDVSARDLHVNITVSLRGHHASSDG